MGNSSEIQREKKPRRKWHERTAEKDIRYRGPLNYQHFQILGWLCIVASQASVILSLGARPSEILTLTFTRAAAAEMLERILKVLARAAQSDEEAQKLHKDAELEKVPSKVDCAKWLFSMLDELPKLKISTYDSFFNDILRCFAFGLPASFGRKNEIPRIL